MNICIVGAGISGLTAASYLQRAHRVTLFEANDYLGGHTNTIDVEECGSTIPIDTGFIVFNTRTYPKFCQLLDELGIESQPTSMSFSVTCEKSGLSYNGTDLKGLFAQPRNAVNPRFLRMLTDFFRFQRIANVESNGWQSDFTVGQFFAQHSFGMYFREKYFLPMASAIWSCPQGTIMDFPIRFIVDFYRNHGLLNIRDRPIWRVIKNGSRSYVEAMAKRMSDVRICLGTPVRAVRRSDDDVVVVTDRETGRFDHVILACHSDQALDILGAGATPRERAVLGSFPYEQNVATLHTDINTLPSRKRAWASWNYRIHKPHSARTDIPVSDKATVTYNMNILQGLKTKNTYCVTLNDDGRISEEKVIRKICYAHPVFDSRRYTAQEQHEDLTGKNRTSFCGAYWGNGFHEDGVNSALTVCRILGVPKPRLTAINA